MINFEICKSYIYIYIYIEAIKNRKTWMFPSESIPYTRAPIINTCCAFRLAQK